jgi:DNA-binding transcriptional LysR family regulator
MDTRQLAAFCAVVARRSFSQAAEQLGVTQPAVSLQVRAHETRLGAQLLDRSGRRVEPTEAGRRLYRGAQRLLTLEAQIVDELAAQADGELSGSLAIGASTGPAAIVVPQLLCEFQQANPGVRVALEVHDTRTVVELVAERRLELGIVGAAPRHRGVRYEPFAYDEVVLVCPPGHRFAGREVDVHELATETLIVMQEGAGVRRIVEDELRRLGLRLRDLDVRLELGLQESVRSAVLAGYGVTFISRAAVEADLASGALAEGRIAGMDGRREIALARGTGRVSTRIADAFADFAQRRTATLASSRTGAPAQPA